MSVLESLVGGQKINLLIQGMGKAGQMHAALCREFGTPIGAGVTPGKGGTFTEDIQIFNTVLEAIKKTGVNASMIFVPAKMFPGQQPSYKTLSKTLTEQKMPFVPALTAAANAIVEAIWNEIGLVICITDGIPQQDMRWVKAYLRLVNSCLRDKKIALVGPNTPGAIFVNQKVKIGIFPNHIFKPGNVGIISRSGSLTYEVVDQLSQNGLGQSTCVGIGGDPIRGSGFVDWLKILERDPETEVIVMVGEIGGTEEEKAAEVIKKGIITKAVVAHVVGVSAPKKRKMGHAAAIIESGGIGTAQGKISAFEDAGVKIARTAEEIPRLVNISLNHSNTFSHGRGKTY